MAAGQNSSLRNMRSYCFDEMFPHVLIYRAIHRDQAELQEMATSVAAEREHRNKAEEARELVSYGRERCG